MLRRLFFRLFHSYVSHSAAASQTLPPAVCAVEIAETDASIGHILEQASAGELGPGTAFIARNPECLLHIGGLAITGTLGQLFIYYTISNYGPVIFSMVRMHQLKSPWLLA